jgi:membrane-associated phospholipid phosphatase
LLIGAVLVALCYFFVDAPFALWVHGTHDADLGRILKALTEVPTTVETWIPVVLVVLMVRRAWGPWRRWELMVLVACVSLVLAEQFKGSLAHVMGRTWPDTWIRCPEPNPSLIGNGTYGFFPFHGGDGWDSFPSGHTARTLSVAAVIWVAYPWWRWASVVASVVIAVSLLGMNYHFVGDVVGGAFVGALVGTWAAYTCGLNGQHGPEPHLAVSPRKPTAVGSPP